jgi:hypothetical protein
MDESTILLVIMVSVVSLPALASLGLILAVMCRPKPASGVDDEV